MSIGEVNGGFLGDSQSLSGSRKSLAMQPVMMMPHPGAGHPPPPPPQSDMGGPYGRGPPPPMYGAPPPAQASMQNFQL